jgi:hypothetical protein
MFRGRGGQLAAVVGCALIAGASLVVVPLSASAQGTVGTTTSVVTNPVSTVTGRWLRIIAQVSPVTDDATTLRPAVAATRNASVPRGTVTFTITGSDSSTVSCRKANIVNITRSGRAFCRIPVGELVHAASPYSVAAVYSGDENFDGSVGNIQVTVAQAITHTRIKVDSRPTSGTANTFTVTVHGGPGGSLLTGNVLFAVSDTPSQQKNLRTCAGGNLQPIAVSGNVGTATCSLVAGWFIVPPATRKTPHPHGAWNVSASYGGDINFLTSTGTKSGHSRI